jgi:hypothetical protein
MNLEAIAPVLQTLIKETLEEKVYPFGFANYQGLSDKVASGRLRDSITVEVQQEQGMSVLQILAEDYLQFVQSGRLPNPRGVPISNLIAWIKARGLKGRDKNGRFISDTSFAFAIQTNIKKFGIRPSNLLDKALEKIESDPRITELVEQAAYDELINLLRGI